MRSESANRLLEAYDEVFRKLGYSSFQGGIQAVCKEVKAQLDKLKQARTRTGLEAMLRKEKEPSEQRLEAMVSATRLLPYQFREAFIKAAKRLPHDPGGKPKVLTPEDCAPICSQIGGLISQGVPLRDAFDRLASQYGVSWVTIRRAWQKRGQTVILLDLSTENVDGVVPTARGATD